MDHYRAGGVPMAAMGWMETLDLAESEQEVVKVAREFIASFDAFEMERIPQQCKPGKFFGADDITSYAFDVVRYQCDRDRETRELVHRIAAFFSYASSRLSQLMARSNDPPDEIAKAS